MRARDLGIKLDGDIGEFNAITDVKGVAVGYSTIVKNNGKLDVGKGPVRTGVTAILPKGIDGLLKNKACYASWYSLSGNGEMTGTTWIKESGILEGPIMITNTHSVGIVRDAVINWYIEKNYHKEYKIFWLLPVVAETYDGILNDINGFHIKKKHVFEAIDTASGGQIEEGNVGGGTGMICHQFKGGSGTSSRVLTINGKQFILGVFVQANYGMREDLTVTGIPVGKKLTGLMPEYNDKISKEELGSIIVIVATDAPLLPTQLNRLATRVPIGIGRVGGYGAHSSGDIFLAFSTSNDITVDKPNNLAKSTNTLECLLNKDMNKLMQATIEATEEAILNALLSAETMEGINGNKVYSIPKDKLLSLLSI